MRSGQTNKRAGQYWRHVFDAIPLPVLIMGADGRIQDCNSAAAHLVGPESKLVLHRRGEERLPCCIHDEARSCGQEAGCQDCVLLDSVKQTMAEGKPHRRTIKAELRGQDQTVVLDFVLTTTPLPSGKAAQVLLILEDASDLLTLRGLIPVCAQCKKVRDEQQHWQTLETYLRTHLNLGFTHGLCPTCVAEQMNVFEAELRANRSGQDGLPG